MNEAISLEGFNPLLSEVVKNDKAVKNLSQTAVLLANLLVELSTHMEEDAFAPVKEKVLDFLAFTDEVFKAITPVEVTAEVPEVTPADLPTEERYISPLGGVGKGEVDPSVQAIFDSLDPATRNTASSTIGVKPKASTTLTVQEDVHESARTIFRNTVDKGIISSIRNGAPFDSLAVDLDTVAGKVLSDYERAIGYAEHWRNT